MYVEVSLDFYLKLSDMQVGESTSFTLLIVSSWYFNSWPWFC